MVEVLVNLESDPALFPDTFQLIMAEASDNVSASALNQGALSPGWRDNLAETQAMGDEWLRSRQSAILAVPSAPSPESLNYLLNPLHKHAAEVAITWCKRLHYDRRLFRIR